MSVCLGRQPAVAGFLGHDTDVLGGFDQSNPRIDARTEGDEVTDEHIDDDHIVVGGECTSGRTTNSARSADDNALRP